MHHKFKNIRIVRTIKKFFSKKNYNFQKIQEMLLISIMKNNIIYLFGYEMLKSFFKHNINLILLLINNN